MARRLPIWALVLGLFTLAACDQGPAPTEPGPAGDRALAVASAALPPNSWTTRAALPVAGFGMAVGADLTSAGQRIVYAFGGHLNNIGFQSTLAYNHTTDTWTAKAARFRGTLTNGVGKIGGRLYISGGYNDPSVGFNSESMTAALWAYDPAGDRLIQRANMPRPTAEGVTGVINGKLYVFPGVCADEIGPVFDCEPGGAAVRLLYRYDPVTNTWTTLARSPRAHRGGVGGVINGKFYVAGPGSALDVYDPSSNTWKGLAPIPAPRLAPIGGVMNSKLWVVGPRESNRTTFFYDPVTNTWKTRAPIPTGGAVAAAVALPFDGQSHLFVVGGATQDEEPVPSLLYTP
jgi:N-acetylneuraminic acid mutarotase